MYDNHGYFGCDLEGLDGNSAASVDDWLTRVAENEARDDWLTWMAENEASKTTEVLETGAASTAEVADYPTAAAKVTEKQAELAKMAEEKEVFTMDRGSS